MSVTGLTSSSSLKSTLWQFDEYLYRTHQEADVLLSQPEGEEKVAALAQRFFSELQEHLEEFNGADPTLNRLIKRLRPYKPSEVEIEPLLNKIIDDLRLQNKRLFKECQKKVVPFSSSLAAFPRPLIDTTAHCAEQTSSYLRGEKVSFSLIETFDTCCLLVSQGMQERARLLFFSDGVKHFVKDPQSFSREIVSYGQKAQGTRDASRIQVDTNILKELFQTFFIEGDNNYIRDKVPPELFTWLQEGGPGVKELFEGYANRKNREKSFEFFIKSAELGNSQAYVEMGRISANLWDVECLRYLEKAADLGNSRALVQLGVLYLSGTPPCILKDYEKAVEYFVKAAGQDSAPALYFLSLCYQDGKGVPRDQDKAFEYAMKAKNLMNPYGALSVADYLIQGKGAPKNLEEAKAILEDLLSRGFELAEFSYNRHFPNQSDIGVL